MNKIFLTLVVFGILSFLLAPIFTSIKAQETAYCDYLYSKLQSAQNSNCTSLNYNPVADLNFDRSVNSSDIDVYNLTTNNGTNNAACKNYLQITTDACTPPFAFTNLSSSTPIAGPAIFNFTHSGTNISYTVNVSTLPDMSWDVYLNFVSGISSPLSVSNPSAKWDKYSCGRTLYWRVVSSDNYRSPIQSTVVTCPTPTPTLTPSPTPTPKRVFVTSTYYKGDLKTAGGYVGLGTPTDGLDGADKICQSRANAVNFGGTWKSWISSTNTENTAATRLAHSPVPYVLINGTKIADSWNDLVTQGSLQSPINVDEYGSTVSATSVWTNTTPQGGRFTWLQSGNCNNFTTTNSSYNARGGDTTKTDGNWTQGKVNNCYSWYPLGSMWHLYCFEQ